MKQQPLKIDFYDRPTLEVARDLIGCTLVRQIESRVLMARIIETEAYIGEGDKACHASKGMTPRTKVMFGRPGTAYVYLIYGMYHCLNFVTEREGFPAAVLIRRLQPVAGFDAPLKNLSPAKKRMFLNGPGRLCRALEITREHNGLDVTRAGALFVMPRETEHGMIIQTPRIGVDYAGDDALLPWRFVSPSF
ncbi:DNA-3-methyladenine glycosylase [bacterium]|nr:DNA-3-methyladenine glycosylase [bacterium]